MMRMLSFTLLALLVFVPVDPGQAAPSADGIVAGTGSVTPKPTAPIAISHRVIGDPAPGSVVAIELTISVAGILGDAVVGIVAGDDLTLVSPGPNIGLGTVSESEPAEVMIQVMPNSTGTHHVQITVSGAIDGGRQTRSIAVAVRVPGASLRKPAGNAAGNALETVRSFRATETVH